MIIQAAERFVCAHRWVATANGGRWLLVCADCGHRTDELPLTKLDREMGSGSHVVGAQHLFQKQMAG